MKRSKQLDTSEVVVKPLNPKNADTKYLGAEPTWEQEPDNRASRMGRAFNWYQYFYTKKEGKEFINSWLLANNRAQDAKRWQSVPESEVVPTYAWVTRMNSVGLVLKETELGKINLYVKGLIDRHAPVTKKVKIVEAGTKTIKFNIQDRLRELTKECAGEFEGKFDDFVANGFKGDPKLVDLLTKHNIQQAHIKTITSLIENRLVEFTEVSKGKDGQLVEGYQHWTKRQLKAVIGFWEQAQAEIQSYLTIKKASKAPRKKRAVPPEKTAARFKFQKEDAELKIKSQPVTSLVSATEAWLYDTRKRKLIHIVADSHVQNFTIKGSCLIGFDALQTVQKTLRKPQEQLKQFMTLGKPAARKFFKETKSVEVKFNGRGSESLLILKVY